MKRDVKSILKKNLPTILSAVGVIGAGAVGVSAAVAQHKVEEEIIKENQKRALDCVNDTFNADVMFSKDGDAKDIIKHDAPIGPLEKLTKQEMAKVYAKHYWPTALIFAGTSACIIGSNKLNQKQYKQLMSAYVSLGAGFAGYRSAVIEEYGEEKDEELMEKAVAFVEDNRCSFRPDMPDELKWFYEPITKQYFQAHERDVILAMYHLNRVFSMGASASLAHLLMFLNLEANEESYKRGWNAEYGYCWIDISSKPMRKTHNGEPCFKLCYTYNPELYYEDYYNSEGDFCYMCDSIPD